MAVISKSSQAALAEPAVKRITEFLLDRKTKMRSRAKYLERVRDVRDGIWAENQPGLGARQTQRNAMKTAGFEFMASNEAKSLFAACVRILSSGFVPTYQLPRGTTKEDEASQLNKAERLCIGVHRSVDRAQMAKGHESVLHDLAHYVCQGWYSVFARVEKDPWNGQPQFKMDFYDPIEVYPLYGDDGLHRVLRRRVAEASEIESMLREGQTRESLGIGRKGNSEWHLLSYWEKQRKGQRPAGRPALNDSPFIVRNAVLIEETGRFLSEMHEVAVPDIPVLVGPVNGYPERGYDTTYSSKRRNDDEHHWARYMGRAVFDNNLDLYLELDRALTLILQQLSNSAYGTTFVKTESGEIPFTKDDVGSGAYIPLKLEDSVETVDLNPVPEALTALLTYLQQAMEKGGLPAQAFGVLPFQLSGFALNQIIRRVHNFLAPQATAMSRVLSDAMAMLLHQFRMGEFESIDMDIQAKGVYHGSYYMERFTRKDVPRTLYIETRLPLAIADDLLQRAETARALSGPPRVLSRQTIWEETLSDVVSDPELEFHRMTEDEILELPQVKAQAAVEKLKQKAKAARKAADKAETDEERETLEERAEFFEHLAEGVERQIEAELARALGPPSAGGAPAASTNAEGDRRRPAPEALPAEAGAVNPDVQRALLGAAPPAPGAAEPGETPTIVRQALRRAARGG